MNVRRTTLTLLALATGSLSGCLLGSDPINLPPGVSLTPPQTIVRGLSATWQATATDANDGVEQLTYHWYRSIDCGAYATAGAPVLMGTGTDTFAKYGVIFEKLDKGCVTVVVVDEHGASAVASAPFEVKNQAPTASIVVKPSADQPTPTAGQEFPAALFSEVVLSGEASTDPDPADVPSLRYLWTITTLDGETVSLPTRKANGDTVKPACPSDTDARRCTFFMDTPGDYVVRLVVTDAQGIASKAAVQTIAVDTDRPPSIVNYSPSSLVFTQYTAEPLVFNVLQVKDDLDPFPPQAAAPSGFVWRYRDYTTSRNGEFLRMPYETSSQLLWPLYVPGKIYQIRAEYRDRQTADKDIFSKNTQAWCSMDTPTCTLPGSRVQWVTWQVEFK